MATQNQGGPFVAPELAGTNGSSFVQTVNRYMAANRNGTPGPAGPAGPAGSTGPAGPGVPTGGATATILVKLSATNYDTGWTSIVDGGTF